MEHFLGSKVKCREGDMSQSGKHQPTKNPSKINRKKMKRHRRGETETNPVDLGQMNLRTFSNFLFLSRRSKEVDWRRWGAACSRKYLVFILIVLQELNVAVAGNVPIRSTRIVETRYGKLQGLIYPMDHAKHLKPVEAFLGVPYATPPVRSNRFSPTRTPSPWEGVRMADKMGPVCPQKLPGIKNETAALEKMPKGRLEYLKRLLPYLSNQSEDCLYLNIYAPAQGPFSGVGPRGP